MTFRRARINLGTFRERFALIKRNESSYASENKSSNVPFVSLITAEKVLVLIIVAFMLVESLSAVPLPETGAAATKEAAKKQRNPHAGKSLHNKKLIKKNLDQGNDLIDAKTVESWKNSCDASSWLAPNDTVDNYSLAYDTVSLMSKLQIIHLLILCFSFTATD